MRSRGFRKALASTTAAYVVVMAVPALAQTKSLNVPEQRASTGIRELAQQVDIQILVGEGAVRGKTTRNVRGNMSVEAALQRLLRGTGLHVASNDGRTVTLAADAEAAAATAGKTDAGSAAANSEGAEIIVTGSNIRGAAPIAPTTVVTKREIERSGFSQIGDVLRNLPQNFAGGENPGNVGVNAANYNVANASTVNLRGLGDGTTLTLVNGRRLAGNASGQSSDISGIPLTAISRIEVVADGSSAIYGSDAVGGVVNFILRDDINGAEFASTIGGATRGGAFEQTHSALGGVSRSTWHAMINVEHASQDGLTAADRDFTSGSPPTNTLLRPQERTSAFFSGGADLSSRVTVNVQGLWNDRSTRESQSYRLNSTIYDIETTTTGYLINGGIVVDLSHGWNANVQASHASNTTHYAATDHSSYSLDEDYDNSTSSVETVVAGPLAILPSRRVKLAIGAGWRNDTYFYGPTSSQGAGKHDIRYAFAEARVPLVEPSTHRPLLNELEFGLSGRIEDYTDFGTSSTPKFGLRYVPLEALTIRATWGKSFKAPTFQQLSQPGFALLYAARDLGGTDGYTLYVSGGSAQLRPERSTSWTLGGDLTLPSVSSLRLSVTYFSLDYKDRVVSPITTPSTALRDNTFAAYITQNPSAQGLANLLGRTTFYNYADVPYDPAIVASVVNNAYVNAAEQKIRGLDVSYRQEFVFSASRLSTFADATWVRLNQRTLVSLPFQRLSGTIGNVPTFKARCGGTVDVGNLSATGTVNYQSSSIDTGMPSNAVIASLTTVDTSLVYHLRQHGLDLVLSATNLFDRDPPFAQSPGNFIAGITYDSTNASALGRIVRLSLRKRL